MTDNVTHGAGHGGRPPEPAAAGRDPLASLTRALLQTDAFRQIIAAALPELISAGAGRSGDVLGARAGARAGTF